MKHTRPGFTFIELLIYMGLMAGFLVVLSTLLFSILNVRLESVGSSDVDQDGQFLLARVSYDIRRASAVILPAAAGQTAGGLTLTISGVNYAYATGSGNLSLTVSGNTQKLNSPGTQVSGFSVTRLGNPSGKASLQVIINLTSNTVTLQQVAQTRTYNTTIDLR